jgi:hypothetical protein
VSLPSPSTVISLIRQDLEHRSPRPRDGQLGRLDAIRLQILRETIAAHDDLVRERVEFPPLAASLPAAHERVAPVEVAIAWLLCMVIFPS